MSGIDSHYEILPHATSATCTNKNISMQCLIFTTRKQSLEQGNVFTAVCQITGEGGLPPGWEICH